MVVDSQQALRDLLARDPEARQQWNKEFKLKNDPRITPIGNVLRKPVLMNYLNYGMCLKVK